MTKVVDRDFLVASIRDELKCFAKDILGPELSAIADRLEKAMQHDVQATSRERVGNASVASRDRVGNDAGASRERVGSDTSPKWCRENSATSSPKDAKAVKQNSVLKNNGSFEEDRKSIRMRQISSRIQDRRSSFFSGKNQLTQKFDASYAAQTVAPKKEKDDKRHNLLEHNYTADLTPRGDDTPRILRIMSQHEYTHVDSPRGLLPSLKDCINSYPFQVCCAFLVCASTFIMSIEADYCLKHWTEPKPIIFYYIDVAFSVMFAVEILMYFFLNSRKWFTFFYVIDALLAFHLILETIMQTYAHRGYVWANSILHFLRPARFLRVLRVFRVSKLATFVELQMLLTTIAASGRSLFWTFVLIVLATYTFSLHITDIVSAHWMHNPNIADDETRLAHYFGSYGRTMLTLYQAVSNGLDWENLSEPLSNEISPWTNFVFSFYIAFMVFAFLNVVTGVFLNAAMQTAEDGKRRVMVEQMHKVFLSADKDQSKGLTFEEFEEHMHNPQMQLYLKAIGFLPGQARDLFRLLDTDYSGEINIAEFVGGCLRLHGTAKAIDLASFVADYLHWTDAIDEKIEAIAVNVIKMSVSLASQASQSSNTRVLLPRAGQALELPA